MSVEKVLSKIDGELKELNSRVAKLERRPVAISMLEEAESIAKKIANRRRKSFDHVKAAGAMSVAHAIRRRIAELTAVNQ